MAYRKCTCYSCGKIDIQPNMHRTKITVDTGTSQAAVSGRTLVGAHFGSKKANNQLANWASGNTKRKYTRTKEVWICPTCKNGGPKIKRGFLKTLANWAVNLVFLVGVAIIIIMIAGG